MMRRAGLFAAAALVAAPAMAQDHSQHAGHQQEAEQQQQPSEAQANPLGSIRRPSAPVVIVPQPGVDHSQMDHSQMDHGAMDHSAHGATAIPEAPPPPRAFEGPAKAADAIWGEERMVPARGYNHASHGDQRFWTVMAERLEARIAGGHNEYLWDGQAWYGTPTDKLVLKTEGEGEFGGGVDDAEIQALWGHAIGPWFDLQAGVRLDIEPATTPYLALGVQGLAPYMIHVDATAFLSDDGDLLARVEAEHDMKLTQRLILQPRVEFEMSAQDIPERGIGAGLPKVEAGLRLRYEIAREFAPYIGVEYEAATGRTADIIRAAGDDPDGVVFLIGLRTWF